MDQEMDSAAEWQKPKLRTSQTIWPAPGTRLEPTGCHSFKCSLDSYTVKPAKQFLHSIRKTNYSSDNSEEGADIICISLKKFFNHN